MTKTIDALVEALELAMKYAAPAMALDKQSPSNAQWMVEAVMQQETFIKEALAQARAEQVSTKARVLVPKRMTQAMRDVTDQDDWDWTDLLAAAEAITEGEYHELSSHPGSARAEQAEPVAEGKQAARLSDHASVPRELLAAACSAIDKKRDAPKTLAQLRRYTTGDLSGYTTPPAAPVAKLEPLTEDEITDATKHIGMNAPLARWNIARAVEAAHNAKLGGAG